MLTVNLSMNRREDVELVPVGGSGRFVLFPGDDAALPGQAVRFKFQGETLAEGVVDDVGLDHAKNTPHPMFHWTRHH